MGTNVGISGGYIAAALKLNGDGGVLKTLEGSPSKAALATDNLRSMQLGGHSIVVVGDFEQTFGQVLNEVPAVDLAFIDGFHDGPATIGYHQQIKPRLSRGAVLVYDDIEWSDGMKYAWATIRQDPDVQAAVNVRGVGYCVMG